MNCVTGMGQLFPFGENGLQFSYSYIRDSKSDNNPNSSNGRVVKQSKPRANSLENNAQGKILFTRQSRQLDVMIKKISVLVLSVGKSVTDLTHNNTVMPGGEEPGNLPKGTGHHHRFVWNRMARCDTNIMLEAESSRSESSVLGR